MTNIPFPNPHDADSLNTYLDALAAGKQANPASEAETAAQEFHQLASRAEVQIPQQPIEPERGDMQTATLAAPISNRTRRQMEKAQKPGRSFGWLSAVIVAGLLIAMIGSAWLNREPGNPHDQLAFAPGTPEAMAFACPVTLPNNVDAPAGMDHYAADGHTWSEDGIWISIPTDGILKIGPHQQNTDPESEHYGWGFEKLIVLRGEDVEGMVEISGRRLDTQSDLQPFNDPRADQYYGETGFVPIALMIPGEGCWEFTATAGDASATWVLDIEFTDESIWTQPISFTECPDDAERIRYNPENPGGTMYSQDEYDQVSSERSYEIIGPATPEDADAVVKRLRETQGCYYEGKSTLKVTARFEYENRTTSGRESVEANAEERSDAANSISTWLETETGITYRDLVVYQDPGELSLDGTEAVVNSTLFNPDQVVEFADGRLGLVPTIVTYDPISEQWDVDSVNGMNIRIRILIFSYQDGEWLMDERLPICLGDCAGIEGSNGVGGDVSTVEPVITPED